MKILAFTSIRSDYDLMSPLYRLLHEDKNIDFKIIVSGAHLSKSYGYSVQEIENDGFEILFKIETLLNSDSLVARPKSAGILLLSVSDIIAKFQPDLMIYAGDREDVLMYATLGAYLNIPTIHFFSGDHVQDGYVDNPIRHATSKLSTFHFVTLEQHRERLIKMGELPDRIFTIGNISLDKFVSFEPLDKNEIFNNLGLKFYSEFVIMIFHPITSEKDKVAEIYENILMNLMKRDIFGFISYPNVDPGNFEILRVIKKYESNQNFYFFKNLSRKMFLSIYNNSQFIIGNSSSGICEAASIPIPAINVGLRQTGRFAGKNVIFSDTSFEGINHSIDLAISTKFKEEIKDLKNPYGTGNSAIKAYHLIKNLNFRDLLLKREDPLEVNYE